MLPFTVMAKAFVLLSMNRPFWQVSRDVLVMAVRGDVGGVNAAV